jgi:putative ABC transport system permease protein
MLRATLKGLLARKGRLILAGLAVVLGVMATAAAMVATTTVGSGFDRIFETANANVDVSVTTKPPVGSGDAFEFAPPVPAAVVDDVRRVPGARTVTGEVSVDGARPVGKDGKVISLSGPPRFGTAWHGETGQVQLRAGRGPQRADEVAINGGLAELGGFHVGEMIDVLTLQPRKTFRIVGIYGYSNGRGTMSGDTQVAFTEPVAQELMLGKAGTYSSITVTADAGVSPVALRDQIADALGDGYVVRTGDELASATAAGGKAFLDIVRIVLLGFSGLSLLIGIFLILNTFSILVAQRTTELALVAALGARRRQIVGSVLVEALLVGAVAAAVGVGLGIGVAALLTELMQVQSGAQLPVGLILPVGNLAIAFVLGVVVTVVAALLPAVRASRVPPVAAMRAAAAEQRSLRRITAVGAVPLVLGVAAAVAAVAADLPGRWFFLGGGIVAGLTGLAMLTPVLSRVFLPGLGRLFGSSMPAMLGRRNAARNPRRTAITVATLVVTLGLVGGVGVVAESLRSSVTSAVAMDLGADLMISGDGVTGRAGGQQAGPPTAADGRIMPTFDASVITEARAVPQVANAVAQYVGTARLDGRGGPVSTPANGVDLTELSGVLDLNRVAGRLDKLGADEIALDTETLADRGLAVGDTARVATQRGGWHDYRVVGSYEPTFLLRGPVFAPATARALFVTDTPALGYVALRPGADSTAARDALAKLVADNPEVSVVDQTQVADESASQVDTAETMLYVLLGLSVVIGILGIVNTMALSIMERTRELGLLRAVGMRRSHLVRMVVAESVLMSLFGGLLGLLAGTAAGAAVVEVADLGAVTIPWTATGVFLVLSVAAGLAAALLPATRAAKVNILSAIAYE